MDDACAGVPCELTILMPCLNEAETLATCIGKARRFLHSSGIAGEIVVADNGSTDGSQDIARGLGARVVPVPVRGYGAALAAGIAEARGRFVIMGDSDDSYDFGDLHAFVGKLRDGWQLVMGNRFTGGIAPGAMPFLHRYLGNPVLTAIGRLLYSSPCGDFHCGLRGFDRAAILGLGLHLRGMEFASEMVVKASLQRLRITEVPTTLSKDGRSRPPHLRTWRDGWRHLQFLLLLSPRSVFLYPGLAMVSAGAVAVALLLPGPLPVFGARLDIDTLLYASLLLVTGYQFLLFWVFCGAINLQFGVLAPDPGIARVHRAITLERGLVLSLLLLAAGLGLALVATLEWGEAGFGDLHAGRVMRLAIPSATCVLLATLTASMAFFLGFLRLASGQHRGNGFAQQDRARGGEHDHEG